MITTLVIAAAGRGTRMQHLSADQPKHLVSVCGKPFIEYVLRSAHAVGFNRIIVLVGHHARAMRSFLKTQPYQLEVVDQYEQVGDKYGTAVIIEAVADLVHGQPFVLQNGDSLYTRDTLKTAQQDTGYSVVFAKEHENPQQYGVLHYTSDGFLESIIEKPQYPPSNMINAALYTFQPEIVECISAVQVSPRGEYEITDAVNMLAAQHRVQVQFMQDEWVDLGKPEDIPAVEAFIREHQLDTL